ncbi:MAG: ComF family protein [Candidatus Vogelbacteria bacterium]|nr:ComF family protein [Candidatus Vogelbacteria bacterium]
MGLLYHIKEWINDLLFPDYCLGCDRADEILCADCAGHLPVAGPAEDDTWALFDYHQPLTKKLLWRLKYNGKQRIGWRLGQLAAEKWYEDLAEIVLMTGEQKLIIVPIPLGTRRLRQRGFNQALSIAAGLHEHTRDLTELLPDSLKRIKETGSQVKTTSRTERLKNLKDAFGEVNPTIKNKVVLLIDDTTTTGATMQSAALALSRGGASRVIKLAIARG